MAVVDRQTKLRNLKSAALLWLIVAVFFFGIMLKYWMLR
jgi:hypothetical protein